MSILGWLKRKFVRTQNLPRQLIFVAGKSPLPIYQVLAMKLKDQPRWFHVDIMVNSVTEEYVDMALSLFKEGIPTRMNIVRHEYDGPGISDEEIYSMLDTITIDDAWTAIYPGLGPRSIAISLIWRYTNTPSRMTILKVVQGPSSSVIEELPFQNHLTELPPVEDYLQLYGCSIIVDEEDKSYYLLNDDPNGRIGPFLKIHYDGFLNFKYDSRLSENIQDAKKKTRAIHAIIRELENIFGRNAIKIESALDSAFSRTNPETHLTTEKLARYTFHHFFDAKNITLTCLTLGQIAKLFQNTQYHVQCYVDTSRGMTIGEAEEIITERLVAIGLSKSSLLSSEMGLRIIDIEDLEISLQDSAIMKTSLHVINKGSGHIEGHLSLQKHLPTISISNNITLGRFDPYDLRWTIEPRSSAEDSIIKVGKINLQSSYALAGWKLTGRHRPQWNQLAGPISRKLTDREILEDIDVFTSSFTRNKQTTFFVDGSNHTTTLRVLDPQMIEYTHCFWINKKKIINFRISSDYLIKLHSTAVPFFTSLFTFLPRRTL